MENSPEFQQALKEACEQHWGNWFYGGGYITAEKEQVPNLLDQIQKKKHELENDAEMMKSRSKKKASRMRRQAKAHGLTIPKDLSPEEMREHAEKLRREAEFQNNPQVKRIKKTLERGVIKEGLVCPNCGDTDQGNKVNKKPYCLKCNTPLIKPDKIGKWMNIKVKRKGIDKDTLRRLRGLPDDGGITK